MAMFSPAQTNYTKEETALPGQTRFNDQMIRVRKKIQLSNWRNDEPLFIRQICITAQWNSFSCTYTTSLGTEHKISYNTAPGCREGSGPCSWVHKWKLSSAEAQTANLLISNPESHHEASSILEWSYYKYLRQWFCSIFKTFSFTQAEVSVLRHESFSISLM